MSTSLRRQYKQDTCFLLDPPSFETWLAWQREPTYNQAALDAATEQAKGVHAEIEQLFKDEDPPHEQ